MINHLLDTVFRAGVWRSMHGLSPLLALVIALGVAALLLYRARGRW